MSSWKSYWMPSAGNMETLIVYWNLSWWHHQMETFSTLLAICVGNSPVTGEFPAQRPVTWSFDVFFDLCLNEWLSKQSWGWWFEMPSYPLWCHSNGIPVAVIGKYDTNLSQCKEENTTKIFSQCKVEAIQRTCFVFNRNFHLVSWAAFWRNSKYTVRYTALWKSSSHISTESVVFSCDQAALWMVQSLRPYVHPSVCLSVTPFWLCSHHCIITKFSEVITNDRCDVHAKGHGLRSKVKVTEAKTQSSCFRTRIERFQTVTPVCIHQWLWNDA